MSGTGAPEPFAWTRLEALWERARGLDVDERRRLLDSIVDEPELRRELESLLAVTETAESFFDHLRSALPDAAAEALGDDASASGITDPPHEATDALIETTVGPYWIEGRLDEGGMGVVYRAMDTRLHRAVALKFMPDRLNGDEAAKEAFHVEARAAASLDHPNVCNIHEIGETSDGRTFIAMAFYPGETLQQIISRGAVPVTDALDYALQIARGLAAAHASGIVHRDVKPGNVMITTDGLAKLLDFGITHTLREPPVPAVGTSGTIAYMSPEQLDRRPIGHASDLWSFGLVLYEMCTGAHPWAGRDREGTIAAILSETVAPPSRLRTGLPPHVDRIVDRLLQKEAARRYPDASELIADLETATAQWTREAQARNRPARRRRAVLAGTAAVLLLAAAYIPWFSARNDSLRILVTDAVGDTIVGDVVATQLRQRLAAPDLIVIGRSSLAGELSRMGHPPEARLSPGIVRDIAIRQGIPGYVHVAVDWLGSAFTLTANIVDAKTGDLIDHRATTVLDTSELAGAIEHLVTGIRQSLGRSLASLPPIEPLLAVTADSTSALRKQIDAVLANRDGDYLRGLRLLEESVAIDSGVADVYQTSAFALEQIGLRGGRGQSWLMRAERLRDRLSPHERYSVEADVALYVRGDLDSAIEALRNFHAAAAELSTGRVLNRRSFGYALMLAGDLVGAERVLEVGRTFAPCPVTESLLVTALYALRRDGEARTVLEEAVAQWPTNPWLGLDEAHFLAVAGDYRAAHEAVRRLEWGFTKPFGLHGLALFDAIEGRLEEAGGHLRELREDRLRHGLTVPAIEVATALGRLRLLVGDSAGARTEVDSFVRSHPLSSIEPAERPYLQLALFFAEAGDPARTRRLLADYDTAVDAAFKGPDAWMLYRARAALAMAEDLPDLALAQLDSARRADRIWSHWLDNVLFTADQRPELARVYERLGQVDSAIAVYARYLDARVLRRTEMDAFHLAHVLDRLTVLHGMRQEPHLAARYSDRLAKMWRNADPDLKAAWKTRAPASVAAAAPGPLAPEVLGEAHRQVPRRD